MQGQKAGVSRKIDVVVSSHLFRWCVGEPYDSSSARLRRNRLGSHCGTRRVLNCIGYIISVNYRELGWVPDITRARRRCGRTAGCGRRRCSGTGCPKARRGFLTSLGLGIDVQKRSRRHQETGRTVPALTAVFVQECLLHRVKPPVAGQPLYRQYAAALSPVPPA